MFDIGRRIIYLRKLHNISANKLAKELKVDPSTINKIEKGTAKPSMDLLFKLCNYFNLTLSDFFADTQEQKLLPPEVRQIVEKAQKLTPRQLKILNDVLDEWTDPE